MGTLFFVAVMAAAGYYVFMQVLQGGSYVKVPDVTMRPITEASFMLAERGLEIGTPSSAVDESVPKYYVIVQRPTGGKVVRTGRKVELTVSAGAESLTPPHLVGKTLGSAKDEIKYANFALGTVARIPYSTPRDTVIAQDPAPVRRVSNAARINLLVSDGQAVAGTLIMPNLIHKAVADLPQILASLGLRPCPKEVSLSDQPVDVVLDQQPVPGSLVHPGDFFIYTVRPSGGVTLADARRKVQFSYVVPSSPVDRDVRIDTVDQNGTRVTQFPLSQDYVDGERPRFHSGQTIVLPSFRFFDKMSVEVYLDGQLAQSYYYEGDAAPLVTQYPIQ
jgi:beta-lactam-binding protein with PASTA domain